MKGFNRFFCLMLGAVALIFGQSAFVPDGIHAVSTLAPPQGGVTVGAPKWTTTPEATLPVYARGDLHIHTVCSDGENTYEIMAERALKLRYSFIAITDHGFGQDKVCKDVREKCRQEKRFLCIPGSEVTGRIHLLAIGIHEEIDPGLPVKAQVEAIHAQGGLAIAAHPYEPRYRYTDDELFRSGLDAMECSYIPPASLAHFQEMQEKYPLRCVYNSDAHSALDMNMYTICEGKIETFADLKDAFRENRCFE